MQSTRPSLAALTLLSLAAALGAQDQSLPAPARACAFVPNQGQWSHSAEFVARLGATSALVDSEGFSLVQLARKRGAALRFGFETERRARLVPEKRRAGVHHYFLGSNSARWRRNVPLYSSLRFDGVARGVDVRLREHAGHFEYDLLVEPGASLADVRIRVTGGDGMRIDRDGSLVIDTAVGPLRQPVPTTWEVSKDGRKRPIACRYVMLDKTSFGFAAPDWEGDLELVVDPPLVWSTFLGGSNSEFILALTHASNGDVLLAGRAFSTDFPTTVGAFDRTHNGGRQDGIVSRLSADGRRLIWSTFIGGGRSDIPASIALGPSETVTIAGSTSSSDFPTTSGAYDTGYNGGFNDAFVARLDAKGSKLLWSTFFGGGGLDEAYDLAVGSNGDATITGRTDSGKLPTTKGAYDENYNGGSQDAYAARFDSSGKRLLWATYLGGNQGDIANALAVDASGVVTVGGYTSSPDYPATASAYQRRLNGSNDIFVTRLASNGAKLQWSTFLGGSARGDVDLVNDLAIDANGVVIVGSTDAGNYPTTSGAYDRSMSGYQDAIAARLSADGSKLLWSTFFGGKQGEAAYSVSLDARGIATVSGWTDSSDFPTTPGAFSRKNQGQFEGFVLRFGPNGRRLLYSSFVGTDKSDGLNASVVDALGVVTLGGSTDSAKFPTTPNSYDPTYNGGLADAFVARLRLMPLGTRRVGAPSGCVQRQSMHVLDDAVASNRKFGLACTGAPAQSSLIFLLGAKSSPRGIPVLGINVHLDVTLPIIALPVLTTANGEAAQPIPLPAGSRGLRFASQFVWLDAACTQVFRASDAIEVIVQ